MDEVKLMQVIYCTKKRAGKGATEFDPIRVVTEIFTTDGKLIAENDPEIIYTKKDLRDFYFYVKKQARDKKDGDSDLQLLIDLFIDLKGS